MCDCTELQRLAVDVLTTLCCLNHSACGRRVRQRLLAESKSSSGIVDANRSLISSVSGGATTRLKPLLPPPLPTERQIHRRSFAKNELLLNEKLDRVVDDRAGVVPLSAEVDGTSEIAIDGTTRRFIADESDIDEHDCAENDGKQHEVTEIKQDGGGDTNDVGFPFIHTMLVIVTADMAAATEQIGDGNHGVVTTESTTTTTTMQGGTSLCSDAVDDASHALTTSLAEQTVNDIPHSTPSTLTEDTSTCVGAAEQA